MHMLDLGCGKEAEILRRLRREHGDVNLSGCDLEVEPVSGLNLVACDVQKHIDLKPQSQDIVYSRSVLEHLNDPLATFKEIHRILKPGGAFLFLTPNIWDYTSVFARIIPNQWHARIVRYVEGRNESDVFPTMYRANSAGRIRRLASQSGFEVVSLQYVGQYPSSLMFSRLAFLLGTAYEKIIARSLPMLRGSIFGELRK